jgi:hypothetical protein
VNGYGGEQAKALAVATRPEIDSPMDAAAIRRAGAARMRNRRTPNDTASRNIEMAEYTSMGWHVKQRIWSRNRARFSSLAGIKAQ